MGWCNNPTHLQFQTILNTEIRWGRLKTHDNQTVPRKTGYKCLGQSELEFIGVLRHMQRYCSHICDNTDVQAD